MAEVAKFEPLLAPESEFAGHPVCAVLFQQAKEKILLPFSKYLRKVISKWSVSLTSQSALPTNESPWWAGEVFHLLLDRGSDIV